MKKLFVVCALLLGIILGSQSGNAQNLEQGAYNYEEVCLFTYFLDSPSTFIPLESWMKFIQYSKQKNLLADKGFYHYKTDEIAIRYMIKEGKMDFWDISLSGNAIPTQFRDISHFLKKFDIKASSISQNTIELGCDAYNLTIKYLKDKVQYIEIKAFGD